jgi:hypothetical protein
MRDTTETAALDALHENAEELWNRILRGEDVDADLKAYSKRVERMMADYPLARLLARIHWAYLNTRARIKYALRGGARRKGERHAS